MAQELLRALLGARGIHPDEAELADLARRWQAMARRAPGPEAVPGETPPALRFLPGTGWS